MAAEDTFHFILFDPQERVKKKLRDTIFNDISSRFLCFFDRESILVCKRVPKTPIKTWVCAYLLDEGSWAEADLIVVGLEKLSIRQKGAWD